jgi:tetratricopeptide (TPR) repeat protein
MKYLLILALLKIGVLFASDFEQALSFTKEKNWLLAASNFEKHLNQHPKDDQALYNLGICLFHQNKTFEALYFLEKAYKFNPKLQECKAPIESCRQRIGITGEWTEPFSPIRLKLMEISLNQWSFICMFFSLLSAFLLFFYLKKKSNNTLYLLVSFMLLFVLSAYFTWQKSSSLTNTHGIVMTKILKTFADEKGTTMMNLTLFPGERVEVNYVGERIELQLENDVRTWISKDQLKLF